MNGKTTGPLGSEFSSLSVISLWFSRRKNVLEEYNYEYEFDVVLFAATPPSQVYHKFLVCYWCQWLAKLLAPKEPAFSVWITSRCFSRSKNILEEAHAFLLSSYLAAIPPRYNIRYVHEESHVFLLAFNVPTSYWSVSAQDGRLCQFPFQFRGREFTACTSEADPDGRWASLHHKINKK